MDYFYRITKYKKHYYLEFRCVSGDYDKSFSITLGNYLFTHDIHSTGLDYYGCIAAFRASGFRSVSAYSDWIPLNFIGDDDRDYFYIDFPTNFGYISPRFKFLRTGDFHLRVNFRFSDFRDSFVSVKA